MLTSLEGVEKGAQVDMYRGPDPAATAIKRAINAAPETPGLPGAGPHFQEGFRHQTALAPDWARWGWEEKGQQPAGDTLRTSERWALERCTAIRRHLHCGAGESSPCTRELPLFVEGAGGMQEGMIRRAPRWLPTRR